MSCHVVYLKGLLFEFFGTTPLENKLFGEVKEILESIEKSGKIEEDTEKLLSEVITNYKKSNFEKK